MPDSSGKGRLNKLTRLLRPGSSGSPESGKSEGSDKSGAVSKRREQVYKAQKRHRNRKAEYIQSLEDEIARLQHLDAVTNSEKQSLAHQNEAIKAVLATHSVESHMDVMTFDSSSAREDSSGISSAGIDIRFDPDIGHERVFMDVDDNPEMNWTSSSAPGSDPPPERPVRGHGPVKGDSWAALDFILALEWPCKEHIHHHSINPPAKSPDDRDLGDFHGHALTATKAVYESALPPPTTGHKQAELLAAAKPNQNGSHPKAPSSWQLPHAEIDKLVALSEQLQLEDEQMTPARAYSCIRHDLPSETFLRPALEALKIPLAKHVQCSGFGAYMPSEVFFHHFEKALQALQSAQPQGPQS